MSEDAPTFSKPVQRSLLFELFLSLARETRGKAVTSGVCGLSLNGRRNYFPVLGALLRFSLGNTVIFLPYVTLLLLSVLWQEGWEHPAILGCVAGKVPHVALHCAVPCRCVSNSRLGLPALGGVNSWCVKEERWFCCLFSLSKKETE